MDNGTIAILVAVAAGVTELAKSVGFPARLAPLLSLGLGIAVMFLTIGAITGPAAITGAIIGLTASGFYSGAKALAGK